MDHKVHFSTFSQAEDPHYSRFQHMRDGFLSPLCRFLTGIGIKADHLSYFNLVLAAVFVYFLTKNSSIAFVVGLAGLCIDGLDGCLARYQKTTSNRGALLDIAVDHIFFFIVVLALIYTKTIDGFWGATYSLNYLLMITLVIVMRNANLHVFPIVRSKLYLYLLWAIFIFTGMNYLDVFLVFFSIYMVLTNLFLFHTYRWSLS